MKFYKFNLIGAMAGGSREFLRNREKEKVFLTQVKGIDSPDLAWAPWVP